MQHKQQQWIGCNLWVVVVFGRRRQVCLLVFVLLLSVDNGQIKQWYVMSQFVGVMLFVIVASFFCNVNNRFHLFVVSFHMVMGHRLFFFEADALLCQLIKAVSQLIATLSL